MAELVGPGCSGVTKQAVTGLPVEDYLTSPVRPKGTGAWGLCMLLFKSVQKVFDF
jgi:hypothetical protein